MKRKKLWITVVAIALLAPSLVLCFLMLKKDEFTLKDFSDASSLFLIDAEGEQTLLQEGEEGYALLGGVLSLAEKNGGRITDGAPSWLYTVRTEDGKNSCKIGLSDGQTAVLWKKETYVLTYPRLQAGETVMYPALVRYGIETPDGYIDAPLLSQGAETIYSFHTLSELGNLSFNEPCESVSLEILLYEPNADVQSASFAAFDEITFDTSRVYTIFVNVEAIMDGYRVQCGYEMLYSPKN